MTQENFPFQTTPQTFREVGQALARIKKSLIYHNFAATAAPSALTDDVTQGYEVGSVWYDTTNDQIYECIDATDGAAVWLLSAPTSGSSPASGSYVTMAAEAGLSSERVLTSTTSIVVVDGGANTTATLQRAALTGDATASQNANALTLATVNSNVGTFGSATQVAQVTVNAKGLVTAASNVSIVAPVATTITVASESTDTTCFPLFVTDSAAGSYGPKTTSTLTFNSNTGALGATTLELGGATDATLSYVGANTLAIEGVNIVTVSATQNLSNKTLEATCLVTPANEATDTTCFPLFSVNAATASAIKTNTGLTYNSNTNSLAATTFVGALTGNASSATVATNVTVASETSDTTCCPLFVTTATPGDLPPKLNGGFTFDAANANLAANNFTPGYTTTATAAGTTTLTVASDQQQHFTGTSTQTVEMPATSTLVTGFTYRIVNRSTGLVTVNSSGGNQIIILPSQTEVMLVCISTVSTTAAGWQVIYGSSNSGQICARFIERMPPATSFATEAIIAGASSPAESLPVLAFPTTPTTYMDFKCELSPKYAGGGLTIKITWSAESATSTAFRWEAALRRVEDDADDFDSSAHTYDYNGVDATSPTVVGEWAFDTITFTHGSDMDSVAAGETFILRVRRDVDDDSAAGNAYLISLSIRET